MSEDYYADYDDDCSSFCPTCGERMQTDEDGDGVMTMSYEFCETCGTKDYGEPVRLTEQLLRNRVTTHPNNTEYFNGQWPDPEMFEPIGPTLAVQVHMDAEGNTSRAGVLLPDAAISTYRCPSYVVLWAGPTCKMGYVKGDVVYIPKEIQMPIVRAEGWAILLVHEERTLGRSPKYNVYIDEFYSKLPEGTTFERMRDGKRRYDVDEEAHVELVKRLDPLAAVMVRRAKTN